MDKKLEEYINAKIYKNYELEDNFVPDLIKLSENEDKNIRLRAVYALGKILTRNPEINRKSMAISKEGEESNSSDEIIKVLKRALDDDSGWVVGHAASFLSKIHYPDYRMIELLRDGCPWVRHTVAEAVGEISTHDAEFAEKAIPELIYLLNDKSVHVQSVATESLMRIASSKSLTTQRRKEIWRAIELSDKD